MTDSELNEKLAKLCGRTPVEGLKGAYVEPLGFAGEETCWSAAGRKIVHWNPIESWRQVHDFVIPAMNNLGLDVKLAMLSGWANRSSIWRDDQILRGTSEGNDESHCKVTCIAILDAWEALEKLEAAK